MKETRTVQEKENVLDRDEKNDEVEDELSSRNSDKSSEKDESPEIFEDELMKLKEAQDDEKAAQSKNISVSNYITLMREEPDFFYYVCSMSITIMSEYITLIANINMIEDFQTGETNSIYISILVVIKQSTAVFTSLFFGGPLADSKDRRKVMRCLDSISTFVALLNFIPLYYKSIGGVYAVVATYQLIYGLYEPSRGAVIPTMFMHDKLKFRMAIVLTITLMQGVMGPIGSALGGFIVNYFGLKVCFIVDSLAFLSSALLLNRMKGNYNAQKDPNYVPKVYPNLVVRAFSMVTEGVQYCRQKFWARLVVFRSIIGFQYGAMDVLMVVFSETLPGNNTLNLAFLYLSLGIGSFIGPVAGTRSPTLKQCQLIGIFGMILNFSGIAGMGITSTLVNNLWVVCLFNIVRASGGKIAGVNSRLMLNRLADDRMMGRVMALDYIGFVLMSSCGAILCGVLEDYYFMDGSETTFVIVGILAFVTLTWVIYHNNNKGAASPECIPYDEKKVPSIKNGHAEDDDSEDKTNPFFLWLPVVMAATLGMYFALKSDLASTDDDDNDTVVMSLQNVSLQNVTSYDSCFIKPEFSYLYPPGVKLSDFGV